MLFCTLLGKLPKKIRRAGLASSTEKPSGFIGVAAFCFTRRSRLFELASVLVRLDRVARCIVNANHSIMRTTAKLCVVDCIIRLAIPEVTEGQRIGD
jgi:hypothetical protein